ncbi:MAG: ribonuclease H-like domain-containing protein [Nanoarchaeota archaeon]|nr:ribonuclease H-like domain-containing protein [Nanoarchaeota archaeon]
MLKSTFVHIPRVSRDFEKRLWTSNILDWDGFLNSSNTELNNSKRQIITEHVLKSMQALENQDFDFFLENIPSNQHWRLYPELKDNCCFLDIETTGLSKRRDDVTVIGLYNGNESKIYVKGQNLDEFQNEIKKYKMIITYNGKCFDVPFLKAKFPEVDFNKFHIDLRFVMREIGYSGGLKYIEKAVGIKRNDELQDIDGFEAVRLWYKHLRGDEEALRLLIEYNKADIENLKFLMDFTFDKLKKKYLFNEI